MKLRSLLRIYVALLNVGVVSRLGHNKRDVLDITLVQMLH